MSSANSSSQDDSALLERAYMGDEGAWQVLVSRHRSALLNAAKANLNGFRGDREDRAREVVQEALVNVWEAIAADERIEGSLRTHLVGVVASFCKRHPPPSSPLPERFGEEALAAPEVEPEAGEEASPETRLVTVEELRPYLPGEHLRALEMAAEHTPLAAIAEAYGVSAQTVKNMLGDARRVREDLAAGRVPAKVAPRRGARTGAREQAEREEKIREKNGRSDLAAEVSAIEAARDARKREAEERARREAEAAELDYLRACERLLREKAGLAPAARAVAPPPTPKAPKARKSNAPRAADDMARRVAGIRATAAKLGRAEFAAPDLIRDWCGEGPRPTLDQIRTALLRLIREGVLVQTQKGFRTERAALYSVAAHH